MTDGIAVRGMAPGAGASWPRELPARSHKQNSIIPQDDFTRASIGFLDIDSQAEVYRDSLREPMV
jgi:hypothetical protein